MNQRITSWFREQTQLCRRYWNGCCNWSRLGDCWRVTLSYTSVKGIAVGVRYPGYIFWVMLAFVALALLVVKLPLSIRLRLTFLSLTNALSL
ncbi:hypothetical protein FKP32DRAFT_1140873 [Trametes sanguinea]|nr:hypothetical protein FKP32DRAFT_1140873 [Trametes sanguinea]